MVYAGYPARWTMQSSDTSTCAASLWVPGAGIRVRLEMGANTIELPALPAGTLNYTCAMGMYGGKITVVDRPAEETRRASPGAPAGAGAPVGVATAAAEQPPRRPLAARAAATAAPKPTLPAVQELRTYQDEGGYGPADAESRPASRPSGTSTPGRRRVRRLHRRARPEHRVVLEPGDNVIDLPALKAGKLEYTCAMGMYYGLRSLIE